jgi:hypothetical protein
VESLGLHVAEELSVDGYLGLASDASLLEDNVMNLDGEGANDPRENDVVHLDPGGIHRSNDVVKT